MCPRCGDLVTGADGRCDECGYQLLVKPRGERRCRQGHVIAGGNALIRANEPSRLPECRTCHNKRQLKRDSIARAAYRQREAAGELTKTEIREWAAEQPEALWHLVASLQDVTL